MAERARLVDLLILRGEVLGQIADHVRTAELALVLVREAPDDGAAWLARARTLATFHCLPAALADLDAVLVDALLTTTEGERLAAWVETPASGPTRSS